MNVEVVYIGESSQAMVTVDLHTLGSEYEEKELKNTDPINKKYTVLQVIVASNILQKFPEFNQSLLCQTLAHRVGIFGKIVPLTRIVKAGDRLEIYRPLKKDPKHARREKARRIAKQNKIKNKK